MDKERQIESQLARKLLIPICFVAIFCALITSSMINYTEYLFRDWGIMLQSSGIILAFIPLVIFILPFFIRWRYLFNS